MKILDKLKSARTAKKSVIQRGKLIVLDGIDGAGKATQTQLLKKTLEENGYQVAMADFPQYGKPSAAPLEAYLNGAYGADLNAYAASTFYAIDRFAASTEIRQWLDAGTIVISNRYVSANAGHQGGKIDDKFERLKFYKWLDHLEYAVFGIPKPDLTVILHITAKQAQTLIGQKSGGNRQYIKDGKDKMSMKQI